MLTIGMFFIGLNSLAFVHHHFILGKYYSEMTAQMFIMPSIVGTLFGYVLTMTRGLRDSLAEHVTALEARRLDLEELNATLEERVEARGTQLAAKEIELLQAQKMEALGQLSGSVAHDFNNLLTAIVGWSDLLADALKDDAPKRRMVNEILKSGLRAEALTRRLLVFSRSADISQPEPVSVHHLLTSMHPTLLQLTGEGCKLIFDFNAPSDNLLADKRRFELVVINLVVNARDASSAMGTISVRTEVVTVDEQDFLRINVQDDGCGMSEELQTKIFDPLFTTKRSNRGTGLGLSTGRDMIEEMNGTLTVDSEVGKGSTFHITVPLCGDEIATSAEGVSVADTKGGSETILVVDDDPSILHLVKYVLSQKGYTVLESTSPSEAQTQHDNQKIDLLLSDVIMPGQDGPSLALSILEKQPKLKVLFMSGFAPDTFQHFFDGMTGYTSINKPFNSTQLLKSVRAVLDSEDSLTRN